MELVLKINSVNNDQKSYQDGDIVQTFTNDHIHICHAEMICHPKHFALNTFGLRDRNTLLEKFMEKTSKYKFTRLNSNDVQRLNLLTNEEDILNTIPNSNNEYIDVYTYITRRKKHLRHKIFGVSHGNEVWYGGIVTKDKVVIDTVWNDIETESNNLKSSHTHWPLSDIEKRHFLPLNCIGYKFNRQTWTSEVKELSIGTACERGCCVCEPDVVVLNNEGEDDGTTEEGPMIAKRKWQVPYWDLNYSLGINVGDVRNKNKEVDIRSDAPLIQRNKIDDINIDKVEEGIITI